MEATLETHARPFFNTMNKPKIMIDAGHGGKDSGAVGPNGLRESDVALSVAMLLGARLVGDCEVGYTRRDDRFVELGQRAMMANDWEADAFLSIHCNSGPPGSGSGFEVFTSIGDTPSDNFATDLFQAFGDEFPEKARRMDMRDGDPDKEASFAVIRLTRMRAALFELEFIHTTGGENWLRHPANQAACARALAVGVRRHFRLGNGKNGNDRTDVEVPLKTLIAGKLTEIQTLLSKLP